MEEGWAEVLKQGSLSVSLVPLSLSARSTSACPSPFFPEALSTQPQGSRQEREQPAEKKVASLQKHVPLGKHIDDP